MTILWDPPPSNSRNGKIERYETWLEPVKPQEAAIVKNVLPFSRLLRKHSDITSDLSKLYWHNLL